MRIALAGGSRDLRGLTEYNKFGILCGVIREEKSDEKPLVVLHGEIKTPPFSKTARIEAGTYLRMLQKGMSLSMPISRPMPGIGRRCAELRIVDEHVTWRIVYRVDGDAILIAEVFAKKTQATPKAVIDICKRRLREYDRIANGG